MPDTSPQGPVLAVLSEHEAARLRAAHRAMTDATRTAELLAARAKVAVGEAHESLLAIERELGGRYGYDPDQPARLDGMTLIAVTVAPAGGGQ